MPTFLSCTILGAGWLGRPLAHQLAARGHRVRVTTTSTAKQAELRAAGLDAHLLRLEADTSPAAIKAALGSAEILVVTLPPGARGGDYAPHLSRLRALAAALPTTAVRRVLLLSSTAVYADQPGAPEVAEADADPTHPLCQAEQLLSEGAEWRATAVRLGGLYGPGRHPGHFFGAGRIIAQPDAPVNMLHLTDALGALTALLEQPTPTPAAVNVVAARHPARSTFYTAASALLQAPQPAFALPGSMVGKRVSGALLRQLTSYAFCYGDPLPGLAAC